MTVEKLEELIPRFEQRDKLVPAKSDLRTLQQNPGRKYGGGGGWSNGNLQWTIIPSRKGVGSNTYYGNYDN